MSAETCAPRAAASVIQIVRPWIPAIGLGVAVVGWLIVGNPFAADAPAHNEHHTGPEETPTEVQLPPEKLQAANLQFAKVVRESIQPTRMVPATVTYNANKHLTVVAPVAAVVRRIIAEPGKTVAAGTELAVLSSSEVGLARDEVARNEDDVRLAKQQFDWSEEVVANVETLLKSLQTRPKLGDLETELKGKVLGDHRDKLISAYSRLVLAESMTSDLDNPAMQGSLSQRTVQERKSAREVAQAGFQGLCETSRFAAKQEHQKQAAELRHTERQLRISQDRLANLLGPYAAVSDSADDSLSEFVVRAPLACRIEDRHITNAARVAAGAELFDLADVSKLWVSAEIHERDWAALSLAGNADLHVRIPALNNAVFVAPFRFAGAKVAQETRSVPLIAELDNEDGKLRPGMFAWAQVPLAVARDVLVVPEGAIMRHQNQPFVFVPEGVDRFRRVDVQTGLETQGKVEILEGLEEGTSVVVSGSFILKSELLLEREE